jgi:hypothetical protein
MAKLPSDILLPVDVETDTHLPRARAAAFVPITLALLGIGAILIGGISARSVDPDGRYDSVVTGSISDGGAISASPVGAPSPVRWE